MALENEMRHCLLCGGNDGRVRSIEAHSSKRYFPTLLNLHSLPALQCFSSPSLLFSQRWAGLWR
jgi:hypothetical protein